MLHSLSHAGLAKRGTGVLRQIDGRWKICQYHLTLPIPNALAPKVVQLIREAPAQGK